MRNFAAASSGCVTPAEVERRLDRARAWFASRGQTPFEFQEAMLWPHRKTVIVADTHFGIAPLR